MQHCRTTNNSPPPPLSYHVYIDENGDAAGNYTVLSRGTVRNNRNQTVFGLLPAGTFSHKTSSSYGNSDALPVSNLRVSLCSLSRSCSLSDTIIPALICLLIPAPRAEAGKPRRFDISNTHTRNHLSCQCVCRS